MLTGRMANRARSTTPSARQAPDDGFTLVELVVTMAVISTVLLGLLSVQVGALSTVTLSRQRQQATDLANRTMEQLRALPYDTVTGGLLNSDATPALDSSIVTAGGILRYKPVHSSAIDEILVTRTAANCPQTNTSTPADCPPAPLYPHVQTGSKVKIGKVQFRVATYVTLVSTVPTDTSEGYWLSVDVSWSSPQSKGRTTRVSTRSQIFSPDGCLDTATHPFSGPCQAHFEASAGSTPSGISVSTDAASGVALSGNPLQSASLTAPMLSAIVQSEQIVSTQSASTGSQIRYTTGGVETSTTPVAASTGSTTDPATGEPTAPADSVETPAGSTVPVTGSGSRFLLERGAVALRAASTTRAVAAAEGCRTVTGASVESTQACSSGKTEHSGALAASLEYGQVLPLASIGTGLDPSRALAGRFISPGGPRCAATSGIGCIVADTDRSVAKAWVGGVPPGAQLPDGSDLPDDFTMVSVVDHRTTATVESGVGAAAPSAARQGDLYYSGGGPAPVPLAAPAAQAITLQPVTFSYTGPLGPPVDVVMSGDVKVSEAVVPGASTGTCEPTPCGVEASSGSVIASVTYDLSSGGVPAGRFTVTLDLGAATAQSSYRAAPSG